MAKMFIGDQEIIGATDAQLTFGTENFDGSLGWFVNGVPLFAPEMSDIQLKRVVSRYKEPCRARTEAKHELKFRKRRSRYAVTDITDRDSFHRIELKTKRQFLRTIRRLTGEGRTILSRHIAHRGGSVVYTVFDGEKPVTRLHVRRTAKIAFDGKRWSVE